MRNISETIAATWRQKLAADSPSLNCIHSWKIAIFCPWPKEGVVFEHSLLQLWVTCSAIVLLLER
jgi:hypothetical protein